MVTHALKVPKMRCLSLNALCIPIAKMVSNIAALQAHMEPQLAW